jgi:hypothetical protein
MTITENEIDELRCSTRQYKKPISRRTRQPGQHSPRACAMTGEPGAIQFYDPTVADML